MDIKTARRLWHVLEPVHAVVYFSPEIPETDAALGLRGFWMSYFAGRAAPMGAVGAPVVTASFFNFAPAMVERAIPDAWALASPSAVLEARLDAVDHTLRRLLGPGPGGSELGGAELIEAFELARRAGDACSVTGRPLAAAWAGVTAEGPPHVALWVALTVLREHRGDGHVAASVAEGVDGCEAHVLLAATGAVPRATLQPARGWTDEQWEGAVERLSTRGWLAPDRSGLSAAGTAARQRIEDLTDRLALAPWVMLGEPAAERFETLLRPLSDVVVGRGEIRFPNPMGLPPA
jgi:hypothetical protein